jgi:LmbE family N-acetylglucosaminyl deacetylase
MSTEIDNKECGILIIAAHPDDEIIGCGATAAKLVRSGCAVNVLILGEGVASRFTKKGPGLKKEITRLHKMTNKAAEVIGFKNVIFEDLPDNRFDSLDLLDIIKVVENHVTKLKPDIVYTHHKGDLNIDHELTHRAVLTACRPIGDYSVKEVLCFETYSSTEWSFGNSANIFNPNVFEDVGKTFRFKKSALKCYESELRDFPHPRSLKNVELAASRWGSTVGLKYAEAFELIRKVGDQ